MTVTTLAEADAEPAALDWLAGLDWQMAHASEIASGVPEGVRSDYGRIALKRRQVRVLSR